MDLIKYQKKYLVKKNFNKKEISKVKLKSYKEDIELKHSMFQTVDKQKV